MQPQVLVPLHWLETSVAPLENSTKSPKPITQPSKAQLSSVSQSDSAGLLTYLVIIDPISQLGEPKIGNLRLSSVFAKRPFVLAKMSLIDMHNWWRIANVASYLREAHR